MATSLPAAGVANSSSTDLSTTASGKAFWKFARESSEGSAAMMGGGGVSVRAAAA